ncbi:alpha-amylase [Rhizoctonia solani]|uniref:Alpha-amylase n=1 Tax=Rhizoctonia solani TaxID=456999 RepID=A0A8H8NSK4_9AGAM|nr:alpha-amylase [Rhizoctonia solani]QRW17462.1 alpha-amylase [Rhizoctonia solani]
MIVAAAPAVSPRFPNGSKTVTIQMFQWSWNSIAAECTNFIGPAGYGFVSPPAEHVVGSPWWTDYQPVSYILTSKRGDRTQFENMVTACQNAGVGVIVDTIFNHMSGAESWNGTAGTSFTHYNYPGTYQFHNFHHCGLQPGDDIVDFSNRLEVQTCELLNLAEYGILLLNSYNRYHLIDFWLSLATDTEYVRGRLAAYANDLLSLGVVGLRLDAAKHIPTGDIANILGRLNSKPYITQEVVIYVEEEPVKPSEYTNNGEVQEFRYTTTLQNVFQSGEISSLKDLDSRGWIASSDANSGLIYTLAHIFMLAYPYGTPTVLSSYEFSNYDTGSPLNGTGSCTETGGADGWLCQHRWTAITGMVKWRNGVTGNVSNWINGTNQQIAFGRGSSGFVAINNANSPWTCTFSTPLAAGTYCDMISGELGTAGTCTGASYTVFRGNFIATIAAKSAVALFSGAQH